jgi:hypothetical protein
MTDDEPKVPRVPPVPDEAPAADAGADAVVPPPEPTLRGLGEREQTVLGIGDREKTVLGIGDREKTVLGVGAPAPEIPPLAPMRKKQATMMGVGEDPNHATLVVAAESSVGDLGKDSAAPPAQAIDVPAPQRGPGTTGEEDAVAREPLPVPPESAPKVRAPEPIALPPPIAPAPAPPPVRAAPIASRSEEKSVSLIEPAGVPRKGSGWKWFALLVIGGLGVAA